MWLPASIEGYCPECGGQLGALDGVVQCHNDSCPDRFAAHKLLNWFKPKKSIDISG